MLSYLRQLLPTNTRQYREETSQRIAWGHWFALFNIVVSILIASRYAFNADWPNTLTGKLYFFISLFGHFSFVVFAFYLLCLFPLSFLIKNERGFRGFAVIFATIGQTLLLVDTEVFKQFYLHLSPLVWDLLVNPDDGELSRQWQLLFVPMPLILLVEMLYSRWCWQKLRSFNRQTLGKYVALFFICCFTATHLIYAWADMSINRPITSQKANYPLSYPMTARSFLEKHGLVDIGKIEQKIEETGRLDTFYLDYPKNALQMTKAPEVNVLLINISGLNNQVITAEAMPQLFDITKHSHRFMQHYASADSKMASTLGIFYGLSGRYIDAVLSEKAASPLITAFKKYQYQFGLFSHDGFSDPLFRRALFAQMPLPQTKGNQEAVSAWQKWIEKQHSSFFSYLDLNLQTHSLTEVKEIDMQLTKIWETLQSQNLLTKTLVIITADIAEQNSTKNSFDKTRIHVPMMFYWQGDSQYYTQLSSHLDIMPTIFSQFFGVLNPASDYAQGIDLTKKNNRLWLLASNHYWNIAIMPDGEQFHIDKKGHLESFNAEGLQIKSEKPPLAVFFQMLKQSNQFMKQ
ncbi:hypothetical protein AM305_12215 [Actinobacillus minor NM305]|uniref:Sulfatase n=1 Tax=Actinobacillus minor NM305 TaxID=637911 RepID=C5S3I9_9PAST|nr:DUF3413 domain-containing protein [Actinobacillus minor]EER46649.1 hypothetical protein AM305_12215 [Actinobacillus minor NM305]